MVSAERARVPAVDYLKALSIVGVALIHAGRPFWDPRHGPGDLWISGFLPQFAVPAFLFASGFLYQRTEPISGSHVSRRLRRVIVPYLFASAAIMVLGWSQTEKPQALVEAIAPSLRGSPIVLRTATAAVQILSGSALEIYYFIFLIVVLIPTIFVLSRLSTPVLLSALGLLLLVPIFVDVGFALGLLGAERTGMDLFLAARNPLIGASQMFLLGWAGAAFLPQVTQWIDERRALVLALSIGATCLYAGALAMTDPWTPNLTLRFLFTLSVIAWVFLIARERSPGRLVTILSQSSLAIYLYHYPFLLAASPFFGSLPSGVRNFLLAFVALVAAMLLTLLFRLALGARARAWLGA